MGTVVRQAFIMASKDTRVFFKDRFAALFAFVMPFMFVIGFSLALSNIGAAEDEPLELVITSQEARADSSISWAIIQGMIEGDAPVSALDYDDALARIEAEEIPGFVSFPARFSEDLTYPRHTALEVVVGVGADPAEVAALQGFARSVAAGFGSAGALPDILDELDPGALDGGALGFGFGAIISFETERVGEVEPRSATDFVLPGYLTMFVFFAAALSAEAIARERRDRTLERLLTNGARREAIILGKFGGSAFRGVLQLAVMWGVGVLAFRIDLGASPGAVVAISVLMALASAAFGVMLASFVSDVRAASMVGVLVSLTLAPLGGCWWPLFITPEWMQSLAKLTPHGWANTGFNKLMLFGAQFGDVTQEMWALAAFGAAFLAVAVWRFRVSE